MCYGWKSERAKIFLALLAHDIYSGQNLGVSTGETFTIPTHSMGPIKGLRLYSLNHSLDPIID